MSAPDSKYPAAWVFSTGGLSPGNVILILQMMTREEGASGVSVAPSFMKAVLTLLLDTPLDELDTLRKNYDWHRSILDPPRQDHGGGDAVQ